MFCIFLWIISLAGFNQTYWCIRLLVENAFVMFVVRKFQPRVSSFRCVWRLRFWLPIAACERVSGILISRVHCYLHVFPLWRVYVEPFSSLANSILGGLWFRFWLCYVNNKQNLFYTDNVKNPTYKSNYLFMSNNT